MIPVSYSDKNLKNSLNADDLLRDILDGFYRRYKVSWKIEHLIGKTGKDKIECIISDRDTERYINSMAFIGEDMVLNNEMELRMILETIMSNME